MPYERGAQRLLAIAHEIGFAYLRTSRGGRHVLLVHRESGGVACIPLTVAESGRNFDNYRLQLNRVAAQSGPKHARPDRTARPKQPTGEAIERAERIAARLDNANHARVCQAIERRDRRVAFYSRLMTSRFAG